MRATAVVVGLVLLSASVRAETVDVESRIASVGLFKNGLAVVKRTLTVPGPGSYAVSDVPTPVHGTFWIESDAEVETRCTTREVKIELPAPTGGYLQGDLAGRRVTVRLSTEGATDLTGVVMDLKPPTPGRTWNRDYRTDPYGYLRSWQSPRYPQPTAPQSPRFLVLKTEDGLVYVDTASIAYLQAEAGPATITRSRPVLLLDVKEAPVAPATVTISYLAKGMAWAPSYRVDISDPETLAIVQKAVLRNELGDIEGARVSLISGFPSVQFMRVNSPLAAGTSWTTFFQELSRRPQRLHDTLSNVISQQRVSVPSGSSLTDLGAAALQAGEGPDIHYHDIGPRTLAEGDSLALNVAEGSADYERIVEWLVPDTRTAEGHYVRDHQRQADPGKYEDVAWDALLFRNPFAFPMTTAPAMVVGGGRFLGQRTSFWASAGEQTTVHVTKALSIRTRSSEYEEPEGRKRVMIAGDDYNQVNCRGTLTVANNRAETVKVVIRRRFSGELIEADAEPQTVLLQEGAYSLNQRNELTWTITLEPGESRALTYRYTVLVNV